MFVKSDEGICECRNEGEPPFSIEKKIEEAFTRAMSEPAFIKGMKELRLTVVYRNSSQLDDYVARNYEAMGKLLQQMGFAK